MSSYTIPSVVEKTPRGERAVDIYSRLLSDRIVFIGTEIDDGVANVVIAQLLHLESESPDAPIDLYLNSPGGSVTAMLAIYDTMQFVGSPVGTMCVGQAASSAAVLLAAGHAGQPAGAAARAGGAAPALGRRPGDAARPRRCRPRRSSGSAREMEEILARHTGQSVRDASARTPARPRAHARRRRSTTGSPTRCSTAASCCRPDPAAGGSAGDDHAEVARRRPARAPTTAQARRPASAGR